MSTTAKQAAARAAARRQPPPDSPVPAPSALGRVARPDGPHGLLLLAELLRGRQSPNELFEAIARAHRPVAHTRLAGEHVYILSDPELVTDVFLTHARDVMKGRGLQAARPLLGNGLLTSEGEFHLRQRRLAQPAFHRDRIVEYSAQMVSEAERHAARWADGDRVDMVEEMTGLTFAVVGRTLFGTDLTGDARTFGDTLAELLSGFGQLSALGNERLVRALPKGRYLLSRVEDLDAVVQRIVDEHRADVAAGVERADLLSWLITARDDESAARYGTAMTDEQLRDEVMTFVLAGHETTAMALSWAWWLLSTHPAEAGRLHAELDRVLDDGAGGRRAPAYSDLAELPWTRAVVAETIRLYPPAWTLGRRLLTDLNVGGWELPSGSIVLAAPWILHRDPTLWDSASSFRPERWLDGDGRFDESAPGVPRGAWIPFGFGNRRCIGEQFAWTEAVLVLAALGSRWAPRLVPGSVVRTQAAVTLRPMHGLPMTLHARDAQHA
ncbi:MAG: cytochrome P450 [Frankiales bacterium]|nr:cytochrome P450 [Frankiales bacterium]